MEINQFISTRFNNLTIKYNIKTHPEWIYYITENTGIILFAYNINRSHIYFDVNEHNLIDRTSLIDIKTNKNFIKNTINVFFKLKAVLITTKQFKHKYYTYYGR